jgi:hypothetical protein
MYLPQPLSDPPNRRRWEANSGVDKIGFQVFLSPRPNLQSRLMRLTGSITRHMYLSTFDTHKKISDFPFVVINSMRWRRRLTKMALQHLFTRRLIQHISICRSRLRKSTSPNLFFNVPTTLALKNNDLL